MSVAATLTRDYFDRYTPGYDPKRLQFALRFIKANAQPDARVIDIGCGNGVTLALIKEHTDITDLTGLDVSAEYLKLVREKLGCQTILGSMMDGGIVASGEGSYDYCFLSAVLHHVIGRNRRESFQAAEICLHNAYKLLKPGGHLIIFEPCYGPSLVMDAVFSLKKFFSRFTENRLEIMQKWINLGHPVVSYYTPAQLDEMVAKLPGVKVILQGVIDSHRLGLLILRTARGIILRKEDPEGQSGRDVRQ